MAIVVGTSSWSDPGFVEHWYPKGLPAKERLHFYAERFDYNNNARDLAPKAARGLRTILGQDPGPAAGGRFTTKMR